MFLQWNQQIFYWLHGLANQNPVTDAVFVFLADHLDVVILILVGLILILDGFRHQARSGRILSLSSFEPLLVVMFISFVARGVVEIIKIATSLPRPFLALSDVEPLFFYGGYDSFPSGHSTLFFAIGIGVFIYHKGWGTLLLIAALLIALSRVVVGIHFPVDILVGALVGFLVGGAVIHMDQRLFHRVHGKRVSD